MEEKYRHLLVISTIVAAAGIFGLAINAFLIRLPDITVRCLGICMMIAIVVDAYCTAKIFVSGKHR